MITARDRQRLRSRLAAAAPTYDQAAALPEEVGRRLVERLDGIRLAPRRILDLGAATGRATERLMRRYPKAQVTALERTPAMLTRARRRGGWRRRPQVACAEPTGLPFVTDSFDLVFSNLALQWSADLGTGFREIQRVLRPDGVLLFSTLGPDTLIELRRAWAEADSLGHVNTFIDLHDVGDALGGASLIDPVMDVERFTLTYGSLPELHRELRQQGANVVSERGTGLTAPTRLAAVDKAYRAMLDSEGRYPATCEVVYGHAWGSSAMPQRETEPGVTRVGISSIPHRGAQ